MAGLVARPAVAGALLVACLAFAFPVPARAQSAQALAALNREIGGNYSAARPIIEQALRDEVRKLSGQSHRSGGFTVTLEDARVESLDLVAMPGFDEVSTRRIVARVPRSGAWALAVAGRVRIRYQTRIFGLAVDVSDTATFRARVDGLTLRIEVDLDPRDPVRPVVSRANAPDVAFRLSLSSSNVFYNVILQALNPLLRVALAPVANVVADLLLKDPLKQVAGQPGLPFGRGGPAVSSPGSPDLETHAVAQSRIIQRDFLPFETLVEVVRAQGRRDSVRGDGAITDVLPHGDSAIWTGHLLAGESFRYAATSDPEALANVRRVARGLAGLTTVGERGLLARVMTPTTGQAADALRRDEAFHGIYLGSHRGQSVLYSANVSRDQYSGAFFGLSNAYFLVPDADVRATASQAISDMLDYLLVSDWVVYHPSAQAVIEPASRGPGNVSTLFWGRFEQQLAFVSVGKRVAPARYGTAHARLAPLAEVAWVPVWAETFDAIGSYYKFNLDHINLNTWLRNEADPARWRQGRFALGILRGALEHHQNAHFNLCELTADPARAARFQAETRDLLELWVERPARYVRVQLGADPTIAKTTYTAPLASLGMILLPEEERRKVPQAVDLARYPVPVDRRVPTDFLWQRHPFNLNGGGDDRREGPGVDLVLPYWMGRYAGMLR